ncbi:peptidylprolyl isomerase [Billgrantia kenyensis]|uniref:Peptidyl-prolyl cis-trans isomerase n=1 Tax=Billgrantia kenyensis TaxID=321266 RepID=A0A7W0ACY7_9GAMM|nr:peptidylprolyl isomerase [Halomonas kenyensis]MBA2778015.1 peptidyl-prolyl cis-trans isomerase [Halomonas kenyensis]MCG6661486.1 peptidyl-prolyl cis-trans isomerase [Halomonas kenyensis]
MASAHANAADVVLHTNHGSIGIELFQEQAPESVNNFLTYVQDGHYDGTLFHRVIDGFMIQGGGFDQDFRQKPTRAPIDNEADNGLRNERGTLAMARTGDPHSATAQFFINVNDNAFLDHQGTHSGQAWGYAVFGRVVEGMDVVDAIKRVPTGSQGPFQDVPRDPVIIERAELQ